MYDHRLHGIAALFNELDRRRLLGLFKAITQTSAVGIATIAHSLLFFSRKRYLLIVERTHIFCAVEHFRFLNELTSPLDTADIHRRQRFHQRTDEPTVLVRPIITGTLGHVGVDMRLLYEPLDRKSTRLNSSH